MKIPSERELEKIAEYEDYKGNKFLDLKEIYKAGFKDGRADVIDRVMELFERQNVYDFNCEDCPFYGNSDCNCEEGAYEWFKREVEKLKEQK